MGDQENGATSSDAVNSSLADSFSLAHVSIKAPPFYHKSPSIWFKQLESQFHLAKITNDLTKYHHVLSVLPENIVCNLTLDEAQGYKKLKKDVIDNLTANKHQLIDEALNTISLGDMRPSIFVNELKRKFSEIGLPPEETIIKSRLLAALSPQTKTALVGHDNEKLDAFAKIADSMMAIVGTTTSTFNIGSI